MVERLVALVTTADPDRLVDLVDRGVATARRGGAVRVLFRDESIVILCTDEARSRLGFASQGLVAEGEAPIRATSMAAVERGLRTLSAAGDVALYACTSSLYLWGLPAADLTTALTGTRGLIAFLADDLAGATEVLTY